MPLKAGQVSLHHTHIVHSSEPNRTNQRRIGIGVSYLVRRQAIHREEKAITLVLRDLRG